MPRTIVCEGGRFRTDHDWDGPEGPLHEITPEEGDLLILSGSRGHVGYALEQHGLQTDKGYYNYPNETRLISKS